MASTPDRIATPSPIARANPSRCTVQPPACLRCPPHPPAQGQTEDIVTEDRVEQFVQLRSLLARWALRQDDIVAAAVVGSWARRSARMDSDLDVVVLTTHPGQYVTDDRWIAAAVGQDASVIRTQEWGPLTERRVRLSTGLEVEFGVVAPSWAATDPVDPRNCERCPRWIRAARRRGWSTGEAHHRCTEYERP